jgi:glycosyltransferase involved in cell wall biosynthesis
VPVIGSNCGDICDVLKDGYNGVIIEDYQDYKSFAEALINVLQNPHLLNEYSKNALTSAEKLTEEKAVPVWKEILRYLYCDDQV